MLKGVYTVPIIVTNAPKVEEGFYRDTANNVVFHLSRSNGHWLFQYSGMSEPQIMDHAFPKIYAQKIEPEQHLELLKQDQRFIESKLMKLTKTRKRK